MDKSYTPHVIEPKWQAYWAAHHTFAVSNDLAELATRPKYYILDMFPYPSGAGLHVGHPEGYTATDVLARYKRTRGFHVLHPMGWDAFGLPAERAAEREKIHPAEITRRNIDNFRTQIQRLGFSYDWDREVNTSSPEYYRWTQWIFLQLYHKGLAYMAEVPVNWCPALGTVLANEEVKDGRYVETGDPVERRSMKQWMLKITAYADRLLADLETLDWPEGVKEMQRHWIGRKEGINLFYPVEGTTETIVCFTTRPDTNFGATFISLAPEHPFVAQVCRGEIASPERAAVEAYVRESLGKTELERQEEGRTKTGVFTGHVAVNPLTRRSMPIWVSNFVLAGFGTGAVVGVPGHDRRDFEFAVAFHLPILRVVVGPDGDTSPITRAEQVQEAEGTMIHSDFLDGLPIQVAIERMKDHLETRGWGRRMVTYTLRDWLFSRQRYWGEPFPIVHDPSGAIIPLAEGLLPVTLPHIDPFRPTDDGQPPLARAGDDWLMVTLPDGRVALRETNTMPQWAGSCWYYLRYLDPHNAHAPWDPALERYWMPVDLYVGGVEHAVLHLLYARFWHKVLYDCGLVSTTEPFQRLFNQGMILAYSYQDAHGKYYHPADVQQVADGYAVRATGVPVTSRIEKMSKSKNNVVNPDEVIAKYGADAMRLYELFMGPLEQTKPWQIDGVDGVARFLARVWRLYIDERQGGVSPRLTDDAPSTTPALWRLLHQTIKKVEEDTEHLRLNTAIAQMMIFVNAATQSATFPRSLARDFLQILAPYAPHLAEELWEAMGETPSITHVAWPTHDPALCTEETMTIVVQVNGKRRDHICCAIDAAEADVVQAARTEKIAQTIGTGKIVKTIYVPRRLVNFVVR